MQNNKIHKLYEKIEMLESKKMAYLEVNNKASARRIEKQIEQIELYKRVRLPSPVSFDNATKSLLINYFNFIYV